jgi:hypothetical protein
LLIILILYIYYGVVASPGTGLDVLLVQLEKLCGKKPIILTLCYLLYLYNVAYYTYFPGAGLDVLLAQLEKLIV